MNWPNRRRGSGHDSVPRSSNCGRGTPRLLFASVTLTCRSVCRPGRHVPGTKIGPAGSKVAEVLSQAHTPSHAVPHAMMIHLRSWWHPRLSDVVWKFVADCESCQTLNARPTLKPKPGLFQPAPWPGAEVIIDFTDMNTRVNGKRFLLVLTDAYSGCPEAYPCSKDDSAAVIKALITHYIPTHGFPALIHSDNGTHFNNKALAKVESILGLKHRFGCVCRPQSQGKVERMNKTLKEKLAKIMAQGVAIRRRKGEGPKGFSEFSELILGGVLFASCVFVWTLITVDETIQQKTSQIRISPTYRQHRCRRKVVYDAEVNTTEELSREEQGGLRQRCDNEN
nr:uncharacterized protein LOC125978125 [Syngnathus scovelli]